MLKLYNTRPSLAGRRRWSSSLLPIIPQSKAVRTSMRRARRFFLLFFRSCFSFLYVLVSLRNWFGASPNVARCRVGISNDQEPPLRFVGVPLVQSAQQPDFLPKYFWSTRFHGMAGWNLRR